MKVRIKKHKDGRKYLEFQHKLRVSSFILNPTWREGSYKRSYYKWVYRQVVRSLRFVLKIGPENV